MKVFFFKIYGLILQQSMVTGRLTVRGHGSLPVQTVQKVCVRYCFNILPRKHNITPYLNIARMMKMDFRTQFCRYFAVGCVNYRINKYLIQQLRYYRFKNLDARTSASISSFSPASRGLKSINNFKLKFKNNLLNMQ